MREIEIPVPRVPKVLSIKIDAYIDKLVEEAARRYGFDSKSAFIRFIVCSVLEDTGLLQPEDLYLCHPPLAQPRGEEDPELLAALATVAMKLNGLTAEDNIKLIKSYAEAMT